MIVEIGLVGVIIFCVVWSFLYSPTNPEFFGIIKPITLLQYSGFLLFALILNELYYHYKEWFKEYKKELIVVSFFLFMGFMYEVVWTFFYWFSIYNFYGLETDIDEIEYLPIEGRISYPYNMNVNSKMFWLGTFCSLYLLIKVLL